MCDCLTKFIVGFTVSDGLVLDLDKMTFEEVYKMANHYCKRFKLEGFLIIQSSTNNYHVVFNRYLRWKTVVEYLGKIACNCRWKYKGKPDPPLTSWVLYQCAKGSETLRISKKQRKPKPLIKLVIGKTDQLINDYFVFYNAF